MEFFNSLAQRDGSDFRRRLFGCALAFEVFLVAMHLAGNWSGSINIRRYFDLNSELTIASWFSAGQLLIIGLLLLIVSLQTMRDPWPSSRFCRVVGLGFVFLSMDETVGIHESLSALTREYLSTWVRPAFNGQYGAWIFIYAMLGVALALAMRRDLGLMWRHHRRDAFLIGAGFAVMVSGAVGMEIAGYYKLLARPFVQVAVEEFLEMLGSTVMLVSVLAFLAPIVTPRAKA